MRYKNSIKANQIPCLEPQSMLKRNFDTSTCTKYERHFTTEQKEYSLPVKNYSRPKQPRSHPF